MDPVTLKLYYKNTVVNFVYRYYMQNRGYFDHIKTAGELADKFVPGEKEWQGLVSFARKDTVDVTAATSKGKAELLKRIQTLMGAANVAFRRLFPGK